MRIDYSYSCALGRASHAGEDLERVSHLDFMGSELRFGNKTQAYQGGGLYPKGQEPES